MRNRTISWLGLSVLLAGCSSAGSAPLLRISDTVPERPAAPVPGAVSADTVPPEPEPEVPPPATIESERAVQLEGVYRTRATRIQRLHDLALPLLRGGVALCDGDGVELGFRYSTLDQFATREERSAWEAVLGLGSRPTIWMVIAGSAADRAGMRPGDVIASMGGVAFSEGLPDADAIYRATARLGRARLPVQVERAGILVKMEVDAERICDYSLSVAASDEINAGATGSAIVVNRGLMRFLASDLELQAVIAHEIAHNSEGHRAAREQNRVLSGLRGAVRDVVAAESEVAPEAEFSRSQEREADYLGMYYLARAGIDTRDAALVWRRMAAEGAAQLREYDQASHPSTPERFLLLEAAHREIVAKREAGLPLLPNRDADGVLILPRVG